MNRNHAITAVAMLALMFPLPGSALAQTSAPPTAASSGNPLSSIFGCDASGGKQAGGAVLGGVLGGVLGNVVGGKNKTVGTALGAALGAATGSYIGCRMQHSDAVKAEAAARQALENQGPQSWTNPETGASGQVAVKPIGASDAAPAPSLAGLRLAPGVELAASYEGVATRWEARNIANLRGSPSMSADIVGKLKKGEAVDVIGRVGGAAWLLVARDGVGVGYVSEASMRALGAAPGAAPACRSVEQTIRTSDGQSEVQRYTACRNAGGDWVVQS
jgi:surface antigen